MNTVRKNIAVLLLWTIVPFLFALKAIAQPTPVLVFSPVVTTGLSSPLDIVNAGDGTNRLFIVQQGGTIRILQAGALLPGSFVSLPDSISAGGESGLLSLAFHPGFATNRYLFIYYTTTGGDLRITRFQTQSGNPNAVDKTTGQVIMTIPHPTNSNHNGGKLVFGHDGHLYIGFGDGGGGGDPTGNGQNGNTLLGKMIRINVDNFTTPPYYTIPADNPYVTNPSVRDEIFAMGLRNPWRWSFDRTTHQMWIADVGQGVWEEINSIPYATSGGINYGWRCYEGNAAYNTSGCLPAGSYTFPIFTYPHNSSTGGFSVTGGYVYRGTEYPALYGWYICADYVSANVWVIRPDGAGGWFTSQQSGLPGAIAGFGEAENGDLYAASLSGGAVYKVTTSTVLPATLDQFGVVPQPAYNLVQWRTLNEQNVSHFDIEYGSDGINFAFAGRVNAINNPPNNSYSFQHSITGFTKLYYRLKIINKDGSFFYSGLAEVERKVFGSIRIYPSVITNNELKIFSEKPIEHLVIYSSDGRKVVESKQNNITGMNTIPLPGLQSGIYIVRVKTRDEYFTEKIFVKQVN